MKSFPEQRKLRQDGHLIRYIQSLRINKGNQPQMPSKFGVCLVFKSDVVTPTSCCQHSILYPELVILLPAPSYPVMTNILFTPN